ncbi:microtubule-associated protein 4 isoform X3 [Tiliqua scincoides]|uniref:microtubule-associated protein 4 isoform X3 n=1 Tax=Tiliqua scincoides TaxID=71010 RepID=UPI0034623650
MADFDHNLSLADALTEPPPQIEEEVKRDFIATLEAEKFDDVIGETVGKTDYVPLLDDDDPKAGNQETKTKPHADSVPVERTPVTGQAAVVENGDHGLEGSRKVSPGKIMEEKLSYKEFLDRNDSWTMDDRDRCFDTQPAFKPVDMTEPFKMHREDVLSDLLLLPPEMMNVPPLGDYFGASQEVHAPYGAAGVLEQPPQPPANIFDPSTFLAVDSEAESLLNQSQAAPAREMGPPEDFWLGTQHVVEGQGLPFFESPVPNKYPDAAEMHLPGSFVTGLMDLTGELQAPQTKQVTPIASPGGGAGPALEVEELLGFEPAFDHRALSPKEAVAASPDAAVVKEQKAKAPEPTALGGGSSPVQEKEERKPSTGRHTEKEASSQSPHPKAEKVASEPLPSPEEEERKESPGPQTEQTTAKPLASQQVEGSKPSPTLRMEESKPLDQKAEHQAASPTRGPEKVEESKAPLSKQVQEATPTPPPAPQMEEALVSPAQPAEKVAESKVSPGPVPASREEPSSSSQPMEPVSVQERPDEKQQPPSPSKPTDRPEEPLQLPPATFEEHLPEPTSQAAELKESAAFGQPKPDPKEPLPGKPVLVPAAVDKPKEAPEPHPDPPQKVPQEEPAGVPPTQVRQANKSSEHRRSGRAKPARRPVMDAPEELLVGLQAQRTHDQEESLISREESDYIAGTSPRSKAPHRKATGQPFEFAEAPRGVLLESWDSEALAALKKKKKKTKQKRNQPARAVETWEENSERWVSEPRKFEVPLAEPCKNTEEVTSAASPEGVCKATSKLGVGWEPLDSQNLSLTSAKEEQVLQTESSFQLGLEAKTGGFVHVETTSNKSLKSRRKEPTEERLRHRTEQNKQGSPLPPPAQTSPVEMSFSGKLEGHPPKNRETRSAVSKDIEVAPVELPLPGGEAAPESLAPGKGLVEEKLQQRERPGEEAAKTPAEAKTQGVPKEERCPGKTKGREPATTGASPTAELSLGSSKGSRPVKTEKLDGGSAEVPSALKLRSETIQPQAPVKAVDSMKESFPDVHKGGGSSPLEQPPGAITRIGSDLPKKRGSNGKSKKAKNGSDQRLFTLDQATMGAEEVQAPSGTGLPAKSIEVGSSSMKESKMTAPSSEGAGEKRSSGGKSRSAAARRSLGPAFFLGTESSTGRLSAEMGKADQTAAQTSGSKEAADLLAADVTKPLVLAAPSLLEKPKAVSASKSDWVDFSSPAYPFISAAPIREGECPAPLEDTAQTKEVGMSAKGEGPSVTSLEGPTVADPGLPLSTAKPKKRTGDGRSKKTGKSHLEQPFQPETTSGNKPTRKTDGLQEVDSANESPVHRGAPWLEQLVQGKELSSADDKQGASSEPLTEDTSGVLRTDVSPTELAAAGQELNQAEDSPSISKDQGKGLDCLAKDAQEEGSVSAMPLVDQTSKGAEEGEERHGRPSVEPSFLLGAKAEAGLFPGAKVGDPAKEGSSDRSKEAGGGSSVFASGQGSSAKPPKRGSDGKSKVAVPVPEQPVQAKFAANEGPLPKGAGLEYGGEELEFVDENRNIKSLPLGHPLLWEENTMRLFGPLALPGAADLDEVAFRNQGVGCPFLEHAGKEAGELRKELLFPAEILEDASGGDRKSQDELQDDLAKLQDKEAMIEASLLAKAGDETREKRNKGKRPLSEQNAPLGKDGVLGPIPAQDGGTSLLDETRGSERSFSSLSWKEEQKMPAAAQNAGKEGSGSVGQETNSPPAECPPPWENKSEAAALWALTDMLVGGNAQLGENKKISKCLQSLGNEAGPDKALEDVPVEEVASTCKAKDPPQHLGQDSVTEPVHSPPVQAASKEEADRAGDMQGLELEAGQGTEPVLQTVADRGDPVARETKKEERAKAPNQIKGYMRPTKSRGLPPPPPPRAAAQEYDRRRTAKSDAVSLHRQEKAKPPEIKPAVAEVAATTTVNDIAAPPSKELPPSPEKKTKPSASTPAVKSAAVKSKPVPTTTAPTKRPASATPAQNKKATSPTASPTAATTTPKRPATSTTRPSTLTPKEVKPKGTEGKSLEKRTSPSKPPSSAATPRPGVKSSPATPRPSTALTSTNASSPRSTPSSPPKRPSTIKTDARSTDAKKTTAKSPSADPSYPKSAPTFSSTKSSATTPTTASPALPVTAASRPKPKPAAPKLPGTASTAADSKKASTLKVTPKPSPVPKPPRPPTSVSAPDLKNIRSKIGSTDNIKHQPGGGKAKVERKAESAGAARKPELNAVSKMATTKTAVTKEGAPKQPNGKVQIVSKKANYSHVQSKCGSKDNIKHVPGGGNVQILNKKIDLSKVSSKCGSKANIKHKPGGGDVKIENQKLNFKEKAQAKVGSLDNVGHVPAGGTVKTEGGEEAAPQSGAVTTPPPGSSAMQENGVGPAAPTQGSGDQRGIQCFDTHIQETN